jgi:magnesium-transporting ATPase (P-type)
MRPNETFLSSLIFNAFMINIWAFSLIQYLVLNFSQFARETDAYLIFIVQLENMWFYKWFYSNELFTWFLIVWIVLAFFYLIFKPTEKLSLEDQIKNKDLEANRN